MGCSFRGWGVCIQVGVLVYGMDVSKRDGVLVYRMGCYFLGWAVSIRDGVLVYGMGC